MSALFYADRVHVLRPTAGVNRAQEATLEYAGLELAAGYPRDKVHVRPISQTERPDDDRVAATEEWILATEPGSGDWDVRETDWLRLPDGKIAAVLGPAARPSDPVTHALHHVEVRARRVAG